MFTLTWKVKKQIPIPCPDNKPDPYTGAYPMIGCAVYHCEEIIEDRVSQFATKEEAMDFVKKAPSSCYEFRLNGELLQINNKYCTLTIGDGMVTVDGTTTYKLVRE